MKSFHSILANYRDMNDNSCDEEVLTVKDIVTTVTVTFVMCVLGTIMMFKDTVIWQKGYRVMKKDRKRITLIELSGWLVVGGLLALVGLGTRVTKI